MSKLSAIESGNAGEHYVVSKLSQLGYIVALADRNTKTIDMLCCDAELKNHFSIQVKTSQNSKQFKLGAKNEVHKLDSLFYVFVNLRSVYQMPDFYVVKAKTVADAIYKSHRDYLNTPGTRVAKHKDSNFRMYDVEKENIIKNDFSILPI